MKKGQAALEYLMTYGWAILVIVIAIGALYAMGVFSIGAPATCSPCFSSGADFTYQAHSVDGDFLYLSLQEGPSSVTVDNMTATYNANTIYNDTGVSFSANGQGVMLVNISSLSLPASGRYAVDIVMKYTKSGIPMTETATLNFKS